MKLETINSELDDIPLTGMHIVFISNGSAHSECLVTQPEVRP